MTETPIPSPEVPVTQPASVAPSDTLLLAVVNRVATQVALEVDLDEVVAKAATIAARNVDAADLAAEIDVSTIAAEIDMSSLASEFDASDIAYHIDVSDVASGLDMGDLAREVNMGDLARRIDLSDLAAEVEVDPAEVAACLDLDDIAARAMAGGLADIDERLAAVERATGPLGAMDGTIDLHRERLVALEERVAALAAPSAGDLVAVQIGPALPAAAPAAPSGDVLALVVDRTVEALLAALNAAAAEGRI